MPENCAVRQPPQHVQKLARVGEPGYRTRYFFPPYARLTRPSHDLFRPYGTRMHFPLYPALKRWAKIFRPIRASSCPLRCPAANQYEGRDTVHKAPRNDKSINMSRLASTRKQIDSVAFVPWNSVGEGWRIFPPETIPVNHDFLPWLGSCAVDIPPRYRPWNLDANNNCNGRQ